MRLNALVLDVINGDISEDTKDELKALQPYLKQIVRKAKEKDAEQIIQTKKKALAVSRPKQRKSRTATNQSG